MTDTANELAQAKANAARAETPLPDVAGLVERLLSFDWPRGVNEEAADLIEAQARQLAERDAEIARLRGALVDHNDALRSAQQVAFREGAETNWLSLRGHFTWVLAEHHDLSNEARRALENGHD